MNKKNFWSTIEVNCWSRGLNYDDYRKYHTLHATGAPLSRNGYKNLCSLLDIEQEDNME